MNFLSMIDSKNFIDFFVKNYKELSFKDVNDFFNSNDYYSINEGVINYVKRDKYLQDNYNKDNREEKSEELFLEIKKDDKYKKIIMLHYFYTQKSGKNETEMLNAVKYLINSDILTFTLEEQQDLHLILKKIGQSEKLLTKLGLVEFNLDFLEVLNINSLKDSFMLKTFINEELSKKDIMPENEKIKMLNYFINSDEKIKKIINKINREDIPEYIKLNLQLKVLDIVNEYILDKKIFIEKYDYINFIHKMAADSSIMLTIDETQEKVLKKLGCDDALIKNLNQVLFERKITSFDFISKDEKFNNIFYLVEYDVNDKITDKMNVMKNQEKIVNILKLTLKENKNKEIPFKKLLDTNAISILKKYQKIFFMNLNNDENKQILDVLIENRNNTRNNYEKTLIREILKFDDNENNLLNHLFKSKDKLKDLDIIILEVMSDSKDNKERIKLCLENLKDVNILNIKLINSSFEEIKEFFIDNGLTKKQVIDILNEKVNIRDKEKVMNLTLKIEMIGNGTHKRSFKI